MTGFRAEDNFCLKKTIELESNGIKFMIKDIPVSVSVGAKFSEVFSERTKNEEQFSFYPYGVLCSGEKIILSKEELNYFLERKIIKLLF